MTRSSSFPVLLVLVLVASSCRDSNVTTRSANAAPFADAGTDQTVIAGTPVNLIASAVDPEGLPLTFTWTQMGGTPVIIAGADTPAISFTAPTPSRTEDLIFDVVVSDGVNTTIDSVVITVRVAPAILASPTLTLNPDPAVPLSATLSVETDIPAQVELAFDDGVHQWSVIADPDYLTRHNRVPVLGMRQDRTVEIEVTLRDQTGLVTVSPTLLSFTPPPLPADFPPMQTTISNPADMEPGFTLFNTFVFLQPRRSFLLMVDDAGELVWYFDGTRSPLTAGENINVYPLRNGNLMLQVGRRLLVEMTFLGGVEQMWWAGALGAADAPAGATIVDTDTFHHDVVELPEGEDADFLALGTELRDMPNYPANELDPTFTIPSARVIGDTILEFRRDGTVVRELRLLDILDPHRLSYGSLGGFWNSTYPGNDTDDWSHANAVVLDQSDNTYITSLRHQDVVAKIERDTGALVWLLGDPDRWISPWSDALLTPVPGTRFEWNYHQHAPEIQANGNILMFDNGNNRVIPPLPPMLPEASYSRAVEYRIDPVAKTVEQVWAYGGLFDPAHSFYSFFVSDANRMPATGNVLVTDGGRRDTTTTFMRMVEVTYEVPPREVFEVIIRDDDPVNPTPYSGYRGYRIPSLYRAP